MALRLPVGQVTVLLGSNAGRHRVMNLLDDDSGRCAGGHEAAVLRWHASAHASATERLASLAAVGPAAILLVDRVTDGLAAPERRTVLAGLRSVAERGTAVLVDDADPVAALAVADAALRVDRSGDVVAEGVDYLAS